MSPRLYAGIDGGGSKTAGVIVDGTGQVLAACRAGGSAIVAHPSPEACAVLSDLLVELCRQAGVRPDGIRRVGLGLSGIDFEDELADQHAALGAALGIRPDRLELVNDGIVALWGATPAPAAAIVHHGTGFTGAYRAGWGGERLFDHLSVGRMLDVRQALLVKVARMLDGRTERTLLADRVLAHFSIADAESFCPRVYRQQLPWPLYAALPTLIFQAWHDGDPAATELVRRAEEEYALTGCVMAARTGSAACELAFGGGVVAQWPPAFWDAVADRVRAVRPATSVIRPQLAPEFGAALMAAYADGRDPRDSFAALAGGAARKD